MMDAKQEEQLLAKADYQIGAILILLGQLGENCSIPGDYGDLREEATVALERFRAKVTRQYRPVTLHKAGEPS